MQVIFSFFVSSSLLLIVGISYYVIFSCSKIYHLAHAAMITLGGYMTFFFLRQYTLSLTFSIILAILIVVMIGTLCEAIFFRKMRKIKASSWSFIIASIGLYIVFQNCISLYFGDDTKIIRPSKVNIGNEIFGAYITTIQIIIIIVSIVLFIAVNLFLNYSSSGKSIKAVSNNPELSNIYGISSNKVILLAFSIGSALAAIAGVLFAMDTNITPTFGFNLLLYGVIAVVIGGVGSTKGLIWGSLLIAASQHFAAYYIDTKWMDSIAFIMLILFLIWKPLGFSGIWLRKVEV